MRKRVAYIKASTEGVLTNSELVAMLKSHGLDTKVCEYELYAETYERYSAGSRYKKKFKCPGDWLAYLSMSVHNQPSAERLDDYGIDRDRLRELLEECPTVSKMKEYASMYWWGDGDDYTYYLQNLTTEKTLYEGDAGEGEYYEEEEWEE